MRGVELSGEAEDEGKRDRRGIQTLAEEGGGEGGQLRTFPPGTTRVQFLPSDALVLCRSIGSGTKCLDPGYDEFLAWCSFRCRCNPLHTGPLVEGLMGSGPGTLPNVSLSHVPLSATRVSPFRPTDTALELQI